MSRRKPLGPLHKYGRTCLCSVTFVSLTKISKKIHGKFYKNYYIVAYLGISALPPPPQGPGGELHEPVNDCPKEGIVVHPHLKACDKYYKCEDGVFTREKCPNGLVFDDKNPIFQFCNYPWRVHCGERTEREPPISSANCPYQFGVYAIPKSCTKYHVCEWGIANVTYCEDGLAYDIPSHTCTWPDLVDGCSSEEIIGFKCPDKIQGLSSKFYPFPRYPHPHDCSKLIVCVNEKPRLLNCGYGSAFNPHTYTCDALQNVPDCKPSYL